MYWNSNPLTREKKEAVLSERLLFTGKILSGFYPVKIPVY